MSYLVVYQKAGRITDAKFFADLRSARRTANRWNEYAELHNRQLKRTVHQISASGLDLVAVISAEQLARAPGLSVHTGLPKRNPQRAKRQSKIRKAMLYTKPGRA